MKSTKVSAVGAIALAAASVLGLGVAAYAVDVPIDDIGVEGDSYPADQWFFGEPVGPAATQDETGLTIEGQNQLLYGWLEGGVTAETVQTMKNLAGQLESVGASLNDIVKTTCFLTTMENFAAFNEAYAEALGDHRPARSTVAVAGLPAGFLVEVEAWAYKPQ